MMKLINNYKMVLNIMILNLYLIYFPSFLLTSSNVWVLHSFHITNVSETKFGWFSTGLYLSWCPVLFKIF